MSKFLGFLGFEKHIPGPHVFGIAAKALEGSPGCIGKEG